MIVSLFLQMLAFMVFSILTFHFVVIVLCLLKQLQSVRGALRAISEKEELPLFLGEARAFVCFLSFFVSYKS